MANISCNDIVKSYGGHPVIEGLDLDIPDHEFVVFLGPSGCGKSTMLRMIAGLEEVTGGRIAIGGTDVTDLPPGERGVALGFQSYALYPHMSVADNITFGLRRQGASRSEIAPRILDFIRSHMMRPEKAPPLAPPTRRLRPPAACGTTRSPGGRHLQ